MTRTRAAMLAAAAFCLLPFLLLGCATAWTDDGIDRMTKATVMVIPGKDAHGSGVILLDGRVLTNAHVVAGRKSVMLQLPGGDTYAAAVLWPGDVSRMDVAILAPEVPLFGGVPLRCDPPRLGEEVVAVGHPRSARWVVTSGRVASFRRMDREQDESPYWLADLAINPGNSGGPVFDLYGRVVGLATAVIGYGNSMFGLSGVSGLSIITPGAALCEVLAKHGGRA